jgi:hypothetical protein
MPKPWGDDCDRLLRELAPQVLGALTAAEDAVQRHQLPRQFNGRVTDFPTIHAAG